MSIPNIVTEITASQSFLVTSHVNPDGDAIGSALGMTAMLRAMGFEAEPVLHDSVPRKYKFLCDEVEILTRKQIKDDRHFDAIIILDAGAYDRIGTIRDLVKPGMKIINIDHHGSNDAFGDAAWVESKYCSTCEMLVELADALSVKLSTCAAQALYTGLMTDTGRFRFPNTSENCLFTAAQLVRYGADPSFITDKIYFSNDLNTLSILGRVLSRISVAEHGLIAWSYMTRDELGIDTEGFADYISSINGSMIAFFMTEIRSGFFKVSIRSNGDADVATIASSFDGGGHIKAAGFKISGELNDIVDRVLSACQTELDRLASSK